MIWLTALAAFLVVNALFNKAIFGLNARWLLLIVLLLVIGYVVSYNLFHKEMYEKLIQSEYITITKKGSRNDNFPWYGENTSYYYIIYPAVNYRIPRQNSCIGFNAYHMDTWCGEERYSPRCNTPNEPNNCTSYSAQP